MIGHARFDRGRHFQRAVNSADLLIHFTLVHRVETLAEVYRRLRGGRPLRYRDGVTSIPASTARSCTSIHRVAIVLNMAHTEQFLDRCAVEVSGCHGPQGGKDFFKSMKPGGLGGHGGSSCSTIR